MWRSTCFLTLFWLLSGQELSLGRAQSVYFVPLKSTNAELITVADVRRLICQNLVSSFYIQNHVQLPQKVILHLQSKCSKVLTSSENHQHHICWCTGTSNMLGKFKNIRKQWLGQPWAKTTMHASMSPDLLCCIHWLVSVTISWV
jgi:hypothetical protein